MDINKNNPYHYYTTKKRFVKAFVEGKNKIVKYMVLPTMIFIQYDEKAADHSVSRVTAVV